MKSNKTCETAQTLQSIVLSPHPDIAVLRTDQGVRVGFTADGLNVSLTLTEDEAERLIAKLIATR